MKIENRSRKRSQKLDGIGVGRIRKFPFLPIVYDSVAYDPVKTRLLESEAEAEEPANRKARNSNRTLSLVYSSASACDSDSAVFS